MTSFRANLVGIGAMSAAMFFFIVNDTLAKLASAELPLGEILFIRGVMATILVAAAIVASGQAGSIRRVFHPVIGFRTLGEMAASFSYLLGLFHMPIANATVLFQVTPLMITATGALTLGERVGWRRWTAIAIGFAGVVIVIRPGLSGFDSYALLVLLSCLFVTVRDLSTRKVPPAIPVLVISLATASGVGFLGLLLLPVETWARPTPLVLVELACAAVCLVIGYYFIVAAMRSGDVSAVAPFRYTIIVWSVVLGYLVWRDVPDAFTYLGAAVIIGSGVYMFYRERKLSLARAAAEPATPP